MERTLLVGADIPVLDDRPGGGRRAASDDVVDVAEAARSAIRVAGGVAATLPAVRSDDPTVGGVIHY
jgi:hypothetical protein